MQIINFSFLKIRGRSWINNFLIFFFNDLVRIYFKIKVIKCQGMQFCGRQIVNIFMNLVFSIIKNGKKYFKLRDLLEFMFKLYNKYI